MNGIQLLLAAVGCFGVAAVASLLLSRSERSARIAAGSIGAAASVIAVVAAGTALLAPEPPEAALIGAAPFGHILFRLDPLSAILAGVIGLVGAAASLYSIEYMKEYAGKVSTGGVGFFTNLFLGAMLLVVSSANAFYFLLFWELMTLSSYFLVIFEPDRDESIKAGYLYMLIAHAGAALIMLAFFLLYRQAGSFEFSAFRGLTLSAPVRNAAFLLAFIGFGAKAGMVPLHIWLPRAHPAAPSHVSALMSGVMIKTAVYGILRMSVDLLGSGEWWWGTTVLIFGAASAVLGVFYALVERDLKRLLAYSSVENIGIILMGVGVGMIGIAIDRPIVAALGFLAALYHLLNHSFFKGLLFLSAGAVISQVHTKDLNQMGGLAKRMPRTAFAFLIGALAVAAVPPLNGFVSEWYLYQSLITAAKDTPAVIRVVAPIGVILLSLASALVIMVAIKAYGSAFSGPPRRPAAEHATEVGPGMQVSLYFLALGCVLFGLGAPLIAPRIAGIGAQLSGGPAAVVSSGWMNLPGDPAAGALSMPLVFLLLLGLITIPAALVVVYGGGRAAARRSDSQPWACGYRYTNRMAATAEGFNQPVEATFHPLYRLRTMTAAPIQRAAEFGQRARAFITRAEPIVETTITHPLTRLVETAGQRIQALQMGDIRVYCLYIIATLIILLFAIFQGGGL